MEKLSLDVYFGRFFSALCLYLLFSTSNVWLNPLQNTVMALGYRLFILLTPVLFVIFKHRITFISFFILELGLIFWLLGLVWIGVTVFTVGIAVNGYMFKYYASSTVHGVSWNKVALNLGSSISGILVMLTLSKNLLLGGCFIGMAIALYSFSLYYKRNNISQQNVNPKDFSLKGIITFNGLGWAITGFVIGVKVIAIFSLLPQFLLQKTSELPWWYGSLIVLNSLVVIFLQLPIMKFVSRLSKVGALMPLFIGMIFILLAYWYPITNYIWAFIWTFVLSCVECAISFLDKLSQEDHKLLIKEAFTGLGSAFMVYYARTLDPKLASLVIGSVSITVLCVCVMFFLKKSRKVDDVFIIK